MCYSLNNYSMHIIMKMWWKMVNWWLFALFVAYEPESAFHEFQFYLFVFTVTIAMNSIRCRAWSSPWGGQTPCLSRSWHSQWAWPTKTDMPTEDPARFVLVKDCESPQCNISRYLYNYLVEFFGWFLTWLLKAPVPVLRAIDGSALFVDSAGASACRPKWQCEQGKFYM